MSQNTNTAPAPGTSTRSRVLRACTTLALAAAATMGLAAVPVLGMPVAAHAHDELVDMQAVTDEASGAVKAIKLSFSNSIIETGAEVHLTDDSGADVTDGDLEIAGPDVTQPVQAGLKAGSYEGAWRVVSSDGHPIEGFLKLDIAEDGTASLDDSATLEDDPRSTDAGEDEGSSGAPEESTRHTDEDSGAPVGAVIAVVVGGAAVIAGGIAAATVGQRRRARGMAAASDESAQNETEDRA